MERTGHAAREITKQQTVADKNEVKIVDLERKIADIDARLARHNELDTELKTLKANIREVERRKDDLVDSAREKISEDEARQLILERFERLLVERFDDYLRQYQRAFVAAIENLWDKYAVTAKQILAERDREAA